MFQKKQLMGEYKERIKKKYAEDVNHISEDYFKGFAVFQYSTIKDIIRRIVDNGIERTIYNKVLHTTADIPFKNGDMIRLNGRDLYTIESVEHKLDKRYESVVAMNPNLRTRYEEKVITLNDSR